jgi:carbamoyl-phosphate synthase large subunit
MPKNTEIKKVLVIGSGPIIIGQAAEFDYAGSQACRALKDEGLEVVLINSNPATIMTDKNIADKIYIEPLTVAVIKSIIIKERPDSILPTLGGQTGLNLAMELAESGFLEEQNVNLLGTRPETIKKAEDREAFKDTMEKINEPIISSVIVNNVEDALKFAQEIGYPVIVRPAYTLGGTGGGIAYDIEQLKEICNTGLKFSRVNQALIEKCISGWKEIEYEVVRDAKGNCITICNMENIDPVGVHTGDSIVVAPSQTLSDKEYQMLRTSALNIISALEIEGGCNVQYALNTDSFEYAVIEVNPRVSRSSALASKATGYPIAKVSTKIAIGYSLDEIRNDVTGKTYACFEPTLDYCVVKIPKWPFDKFVKSNKTLGTQMKATGEVMAINNSFEGAFLKALRSLELNMWSLDVDGLKEFSNEEIIEKLSVIDDERILVIAEALRRNIAEQTIFDITKIDLFFLGKIKNIVMLEEKLKKMSLDSMDKETLLDIKKLAFADRAIAKFLGCSEGQVKEKRNEFGIKAVYKMVDTCSAEFQSETPYYYSTYDTENESICENVKKVLVIGSGPIRIGQGIEFDYCTVHTIWSLKQRGYQTIIINSNPETVSTDFDTADKLYFEPVTEEDVRELIELEKPDGAIVQVGGQTGIKLCKFISTLIPIIGTSPENIDAAEDREIFDTILEKLDIKRPKGFSIFTLEEALKAAHSLGYPVLIRPSYVIGGKGMEIAYSDKDVTEYMSIIEIQEGEENHPILVDKYLNGREVEVDAICDGENVLIPGIMEHIERAGVHSGDSISVYPSINLSKEIKEKLIDYTYKLAKELNVIGLMNIQFVIFNDEVYIIEVNPRASRTIPYISKVTNVPMIKLAVAVMFGEKLENLGFGTGLHKESKYYAVKVPVFSFQKLLGVEVGLGPEMKSTGEVLGLSTDINEAIYKGLIGSGLKLNKTKKKIILSVADNDKQELVKIAEGFFALGYKLYATSKTAAVLNRNHIPTSVVNKISNQSSAINRNIIDMMMNDEVFLIINTPTKGREPLRDGFQIRRKTVELGIPCLTVLDTARALLNCLKLGYTEENISLVDIGVI